MEFKFVISTTWEVKDKDILYDLIEIQKYINNRLVGKTFGVSIDKFLFGYEIADSEGELPHRIETENFRRYGRKYLLIVKQFDYRQLINKSGKEQSCASLPPSRIYNVTRRRDFQRILPY